MTSRNTTKIEAETSVDTNGQQRKLRTVEVPEKAGNFIAWRTVGQRVCGNVVAIGTNEYKGKVSPEITLELTEATYSFRENGTQRVDIAAGERVNVTLSQWSARDGWHIAVSEGVTIGTYMQVEFVRQKGTSKIIKISHDAEGPGPGAVTSADIEAAIGGGQS